MRYVISGLTEELSRAHAGLLPDDGLLAWKVSGGGLVASAWLDDQLVGLNAFRRVPMNLGSRRVVGYQSFDTAVAPIARGRGVFTNLIRAFYHHPHDGAVLYGFPNSSSAPGFFGSLRWRPLGTPPFLVKPLRSSFFTRRIGLDLDLRLSFPRSHGTQFDTFGTEADDIWDDFSAAIGCAVTRSASYLNHRLAHARYRHLGRFRDRKLRGFVSTHVANKHGGRVGYVMEALGEGLPDLLQGAVRLMVDEGAEVALAWCGTSSPNFKAYLRAGFVPLPERLRPIHLNFGARLLQPEPDGNGELPPASAWYLSYLDSDTV